MGEFHTDQTRGEISGRNLIKMLKVLSLAVFSVFLLSAEARKIGKRNGKHAGGKERSQTTRRVYHVAETEESCGNYTELLSEEKPSELCEEANTTFCICVARETLSEENSVTEKPEWQFKCGACELKWSVEKVETEEDTTEGEKKTKTKKKRKEDRTKMRKKLKEKKTKSGKKDNIKKKSNSNKKEAKPRSEN